MNKIVLSTTVPALSSLEVDYLILNSSVLSEEEIALLPKTQDSHTITWTEFPNAQILCNYDNTIDSSQGVEEEGIVGFEVKKKDSGKNIFSTVCDVSIEELSESMSDSDYTYGIIDYNIRNNSFYTYSIFPYTQDAKINSSQSVSISTTTNWENFSLTKLYEEDGKYKIYTDSNDLPIVWNFIMDCEENDITLNQDKTTFTNFTAKPKVYSGDLCYTTGGLTCLLGNISLNSDYYEPQILLSKWLNFVQENNICLYKNLKGESFVVSIDPNSTRTYYNQYANYYQNYDENGNVEITNRPTQISFNFTEVDSTDSLELYSIIKGGLK